MLQYHPNHPACPTDAKIISATVPDDFDPYDPRHRVQVQHTRGHSIGHLVADPERGPDAYKVRCPGHAYRFHLSEVKNIITDSAVQLAHPLSVIILHSTPVDHIPQASIN